MVVINSDDFNQQSRIGNNNLEIIYQERVLHPGPVFSLKNQISAVNFCRKYSNQNVTCVVVKERSYFRVWYEKLKSKRKTSFQTNFSSKEKSSKDLKRPIIDEAFIDLCQTTLVKLIGPIGKIVCQRTVKQYPLASRNKFIEAIVGQIPEAHQAQEFTRILSPKNKNINL